MLRRGPRKIDVARGFTREILGAPIESLARKNPPEGRNLTRASGPFKGGKLLGRMMKRVSVLRWCSPVYDPLGRLANHSNNTQISWASILGVPW